jgi:hypothetical protein
MESTGRQRRARGKRPYARTLLYGLRVVAGASIIALFLFAASRTTRDCTVGLYVYDICAWVWVREQLGLPASKLLRAVFLELIGLTLTLGIFLAIRFVLPFWGTGTHAKTEREKPRIL